MVEYPKVFGHVGFFCWVRHNTDLPLAVTVHQGKQRVIQVNASNATHLCPPDAEQGQLAESHESSGATPRTCGILIVDDEPCVLGVLNIWMRQQGFTVWLAANGQEALDVYWHHHQAIDIVLMDVRMPGLDGPQTLAALQELNPHIRCCFMSGDLGSYTVEQLQNLGAVAVVRKPFHLTDVAKALYEHASKNFSNTINGLSVH